MKRKPWPLGFTLPFIRDYEGLCGMIFKKNNDDWDGNNW
jgi:hypothetical protein